MSIAFTFKNSSKYLDVNVTLTGYSELVVSDNTATLEMGLHDDKERAELAEHLEACAYRLRQFPLY